MNDRPDHPRTSRCALCKREVRVLTEHHLIPRAKHHNQKIRRMHPREAMRQTVSVCKPCHANLHVNLTEKQMAEEFHTIEKLLEHEPISKFTDWIKTKPPDTAVPMPKRNKPRR